MKYFKKPNGIVIEVTSNHDLESLKARFVECDANGNKVVKEEKPKGKEKSSKEEDLARIASKRESIDFGTIGDANEDDKDDLKSIKGIGPFLEEKLNALGIYTYEQISKMTPELEDQVNEAIEFFPGRIKRDEWVKQAKDLK